MIYMNLKHGVESRPIAPIQQQWLDNIVGRIPPQLQLGPGRTELLELCKEISEDYLNTMRQFTGEPRKKSQCIINKVIVIFLWRLLWLLALPVAVNGV